MRHEDLFFAVLVIIALVIGGLGLMIRTMPGYIATLGTPGTGSGTASPGLFGAASSLTAVLIMTMGNALSLKGGYDDVPGVLFLILLLCIALQKAAYLTPLYRLTWDETGITGPGTLWLPPIGPRRVTLRWAEIRQRETFAALSDGTAGPSRGISRGFRLIGADGRRIVWTEKFSNCRHLGEDVSTYRPDLSRPLFWPRPRTDVTHT
ncbi:hypothetical protein [Acidimangrovimonas sediminis]|uniref:hypothetical protein n=1 Tax=Acidimangrovimonas sediminis TaxID=2056283 RepID=UPI000C80C166|nr:hypothetical protein [Acidimangrovimonas sediminis]